MKGLVFKEDRQHYRDGFLDAGGMKLYFLLIQHWQEANSIEFVRQQRKLGFQLSFSPEECKEGFC